MNLQTKFVSLFLIVLFSTCSLALAQSVPQLVRKVLAATVSLEVRDENGATLGHGSGFFVRQNLIATNFHVIDGAAQGSARLVNKKTSYPLD